MNVYEAYKKIYESGLVIGSWGNVSIKDNNCYTITPSGVSIVLQNDIKDDCSDSLNETYTSHFSLENISKFK